MLILTRTEGERILIRTPDHDIWITLAEMRGDDARIGIEADREVVVVRDEILPPDERRGPLPVRPNHRRRP